MGYRSDVFGIEGMSRTPSLVRDALSILLMHVLTRVSAPLGIGFRVDARCVDIFGIQGMPITILRAWFTLAKTDAPQRRAGERLRPAVFVIAPVLITSLEGIIFTEKTGSRTDPTKRTTRGKTEIWELIRIQRWCCNDETLRSDRAATTVRSLKTSGRMVI